MSQFVRITADPLINDEFPAGYTGSLNSYIGSIGFAGSRGAYTLNLSIDSNGFGGSIGYLGSNFSDVGILAGFIDGNGFIASVGWVSPGFLGSGSGGGGTGPTGFSGSKGFTGSVGFVGSGGPQGTSGGLGFTGSVGNTGGTGFTGSIGFTGSQGTGFTGSIGFTGSQGTGFTGSIGNTGGTGFTGSIGNIGGTGFTGSIGGTGFTGSIGGTGFTGSIGNTGGTGFTGSQGTSSGVSFAFLRSSFSDTLTHTAWTKIKLQSKDSDPNTIATQLGGGSVGAFSLGTGTYLFTGMSTCATSAEDITYAELRMRDTTHSTTVSMGCEAGDTLGGVGVRVANMSLSGFVIVSGTTNFELQAFTATASGGDPVTVTGNSDAPNFANLLIQKIA